MWPGYEASNYDRAKWNLNGESNEIPNMRERKKPCMYLIKNKVLPFLLLEGTVVLHSNVVGGDAHVEGIPLRPALPQER